MRDENGRMSPDNKGSAGCDEGIENRGRIALITISPTVTFRSFHWEKALTSETVQGFDSPHKEMVLNGNSEGRRLLIIGNRFSMKKNLYIGIIIGRVSEKNIFVNIPLINRRIPFKEEGTTLLSYCAGGYFTFEPHYYILIKPG